MSDSSLQNLLDRLFLQAEAKVSNIETYVIPKLQRFAEEIRENVKKAREGDETALIALIRHAFPSTKGNQNA